MGEAVVETERAYEGGVDAVTEYAQRVSYKEEAEVLVSAEMALQMSLVQFAGTGTNMLYIPVIQLLYMRSVVDRARMDGSRERIITMDNDEVHIVQDTIEEIMDSIERAVASAFDMLEEQEKS